MPTSSRDFIVKAVWFTQLDFGSLCRTSRFELAKAFGRIGHRLKIVGRYRRQKPPLADINPRPVLLEQWLPDPAGGIFFQLQLLLLAICEIVKRVDLVLVDHFCVLTMLPFNLLSKGRLVRTKFVLDVRSAPVDMAGVQYALSRWRYILSLRWAKLFYDGVTVITDLYRQDISRRARIAEAKIGVWGSGVRTDLFDPRKVDKARVESIKSFLGLADRLVVMYHGFLSANRGLQETVKALALLNAEWQGHRRVTLLLVGDGPATAKIKSLAEAEGVSDAVMLKGSVPYEEVPDYLSICDVGILPFPDTEWWNMSSPLKLMEYLAMEKPVILTDIPAHRALVGSARCAIFVTDNSPLNIARAIGELTRHIACFQNAAREGRTIVSQKFTWERQAHNLLDYVAQLDQMKG